MKKVGFYFAELIVTTVLYVVVMGYFTTQQYVFSAYNRGISGIIVALFLTGIGMVTYHLWHLYNEDRQVMYFFEHVENFRIALTDVVEKRSTFASPDMFTSRVRKTIDEYFALLAPSLFRDRIYGMCNMFLTRRKPNQEILSSLLHQKIEMRGHRIRYIAGILVMIGLLGTFLGLVQAIKYLQHFFTASESVDMTMLFSDMKQTLGGLDKAFGTSISGITAYLMLGYLNIVLRTRQAYVLTQIEEATLEHILPLMQTVHEEDPRDMAAATTQLIRTLPETLSKQMKAALESVVRQTIGSSTEALKATSSSLQQAAADLQAGQQTFSETLNGFGTFLTAFREGREQLVHSQQTLTEGIREFAQELSVFKENQTLMTSSLNLTHDYMAHSEAHFTAMDDVIQKIHAIWSDNRQTFDQLATALQQEHQMLRQAVQTLEGFLTNTANESRAYFQGAQEEFRAMIAENTGVHQQLLSAHTMLTTLVHDLKTFILDEQHGLHSLSGSLQETFEEARYQYLQFAQSLETVQKQMLANQDQIEQVQETTAELNQQLQLWRNT